MDKQEKKIKEMLIRWLDDYNYETYSLSIGHSSLDDDENFAKDFAKSWKSNVNWVRTEGGFILDIVEWPNIAASWLKPAQRLNKNNPDAWILIGPCESAFRLIKRLIKEKNWARERTFCIFPTYEHIDEFNDIMCELNGLKGFFLSCERWIIENEKLNFL